MKKILLVVLILLCSGFVGINHGTATSSGKEINVWIEVDKISTTIEIDPMNNYYFHIKNDEIEHITQEKIPVMDALKRVPNWLRDDLENNFEKMAYVDIDVGEHAAPTLFDIDNDNDFDLVVGTADGKIIVYENSNNVWIKKGFLNDSNGNPIDVGDYAVPTFFDLYNDGKKDLIVGAYDGRIRYYENTTKGFVYKGYLKDVNGNTIDVGSYSAPVFADLTSEANQYPGSKHVDLTIGSGDGTIYYYENVGYYPNEAKWFPKDIYSNVNTYLQVLDHPAGYSKPALADLEDNDGDFDLTVGTDSGELYYFRNDGTSTNPSWDTENPLVSGMYDDMETGPYAAPTFADIDRNKLMTEDCLFDLVVGRGDGHIHLYKNVGTSSAARWDVWPEAPREIETPWGTISSGVEVGHHMKYRNLSYLEEYVNLILDVENEYVDEIAFCIAHTSVDVLTDEDVYLEVFRKNAELIYEIDSYIQYANLVEKGNISTGDYWTTVRYNYSENGVLKNTTLPPDIYYWFVVHPKISDEIPTFINPETGRPDESGVFWREYLFYHADENYPSDPDTDTNNDGIPDYYYPKDESPPLLKDKISNVTVMYDNVPYTAPPGYDNHGHYFEDNPRNWNWSYDKGHAVEIVSNWVEKTLPLNEQESDDGERPIQPVRIAHHHNGNCGELQDLTVAAARTCMIPTAGVNLIGEDHVWSEFYCVNESRDYYWHQWDNHWSDSRSVIDQFDDYWVNWGERGGSGIFKWNGDDSITDVSDRYLIDKDGNPVSSVVKVVVNDTDGNPVDGARVIMSSYWLADNEIESITGMTFRFVHYIIPGVAGFSFFPSIWNYTDSEGVAEFRLADNYFVIDVSSKIGSDEKTIYVGENGNYTVSFELDGSVPKPELNTAGDSSPDTPDYNMRLEYEVLNDVQDTKNIIVNTEQIGKRKMANSYIDLFICNKTNMEKYLMGLPFDSGELKIDEIEGLVPFDDDGNMDDDWYIVFSNDKHIETKKIIEITVTIKKKQPSWGTTTTINVSANGFINGTASSFVNITNVEIKVNDGNWVNANLGLYGFVDGNYTVKWNYSLNMSNYYAGECIIYARVIDDEGYIKIVSQEDIIYCPLPTINILHPILGEMVEKTISVSGTASDKTQKNIQKMKMWIKIGDEEWFTADLSPIEGADEEWNWWYNSTDTTTVNDGEQKIYVRSFNGIMYTVVSVEVIVDNNPPDVNILSLSENHVVSGNIIINGNATDVNGIKKVDIKIDEENWNTVEIASLPSWDYPLDTTKLLEGKHTIYVSAFDGLHYHNITVNITVDNNRPPEIIYSPTNDGITIKENSTQTFKVVNDIDPEGGDITIQWFLNE
ncbi:MAG: Ig-like domain-containing protein, partial [Thermoplasmatales archaeon]|nr:Ig-like domain-containing protein [Thermoplasmatales archaeon]